MKIKILIFIIVLNTWSLCQTLPLLEKLDAPYFHYKEDALREIIKNNLTEYIPEIEARVLEQPNLYTMYIFLDALKDLGSVNTIQLTHQYLAVIDTFNTKENKLREKSRAARFLFELGDYSTVQYVFDYIASDSENTDLVLGGMPFLLRDIYINVPSYSEQAKQELVRIMNVSDNSLTRRHTLAALDSINYEGILPLCVDLANNDYDADVRLNAYRVLKKRKYSELHDMVFVNLSTDTDATIRLLLCGLIFYEFGYPEDLKRVKEYQQSEPDTQYVKSILSLIRDFIPPKPDSTVTALVMADTLISYNSQLYNYGWITSDSLYNKYATTLNKIRNFIQNNNYPNALAKINAMQNSVEYNYNLPEPLLTTEGWKFLHYYLEYIEERLIN